MKELLAAIEFRLKFSKEGLTESQSYDISCSIQIEELCNALNNSSERYKENDIKYVISLLYQIGYIEISQGTIKRITPNGYKFLLNTLHGVNCMY